MGEGGTQEDAVARLALDARHVRVDVGREGRSAPAEVAVRYRLLVRADGGVRQVAAGQAAEAAVAGAHRLELVEAGDVEQRLAAMQAALDDPLVRPAARSRLAAVGAASSF